MIKDTLTTASWNGRSEVAAGMAGVAFKAAATSHRVTGEIYPGGESFLHLPKMQMRTTPIRMQNRGNEGY